MLEAWRKRRLVNRAKAGDGEAFAELIAPELSRLHQAAFYLAKDADEAEDLAQLACIRAYRAIGDFRPDAPLRPWLHRILRNLFLDRQKSAAVRHEVKETELLELADAAGPPSLGPAATPLEQLLARERQAHLVETLRGLPEAFREILVLCDIQELTYAEVCEVTGLPLGTVKSRLSRARLLLRDQLLAAGEPGAAPSRSHRGGVS